MTTSLITRPVTIASLEAEMTTIYNGRKKPTATDTRSTNIRQLTNATLKGHRVSNQTRTTTKHGHTVTENTGYSYRELQAVLKGMGLKASGSTADLTARLERARTETTVESDYPKKRKSSGKGKRSTKAPTPKRTWNGLSYRQAQHLVKWGRENIVGFEPPARNTGWDNVSANCDELLNCEHFWTVLNDNATATELKDLTGFTA
jgi:hypothetical protein